MKANKNSPSTSGEAKKTKMKLGEIARYLGGELLGDTAVEVTGIAPIEDAKPGDLTFLANPKYGTFLNTTSASAVIVGLHDDITKCKISLIKHKNPYLAFARVLELFFGMQHEFPPGIHPTAILGKDAMLENGIHIGPHVVVEDRTKIGQNSTILAGCFIGADSEIGEKSLIYPNVIIRENVRIGKKAIIHSGAVIGSDGFGFARDGNKHHKIPQVGGVVIEDDVEIGANVTIDRATLGVTRIGKGSKIDNLVQIAHNVSIGENCVIAAQVGISGSTYIGDESVIAGQVGITGHIKLGKRVIVGAQSGVTKDVPEGTTVFGYPAREIHKTKRIEAHLSRLDLYVKRLKEVEQSLKKIQKNSP